MIVIHGSLSSQYGGGQVYLYNAVKELIRQSPGTVILSAAIGKAEETPVLVSVMESISVPVFQLFYKDCESSEVLTSKVVSILQRERPDVVHAHALKDITAKACLVERIPLVITAHHGGIICPQGALLNHLDEICKIRASDHDCLPCVLKNIRGGRYFYRIYRYLPLGSRLWAGRLMARLPFIPFLTPWLTAPQLIRQKAEEWNAIHQHAALLIAPSHAIREAMVRNGADPLKVMTVLHGISPHSPKPLPVGIGNRPVRFIYIGRINYVKGIHVLLSALQQLGGRAELTLIGDAVTRTEIRYKKNLLRKFRNSNIHWAGNIDNKEIGKYIALNDVMIHPAICLEVYGLAIAESLSAGRPVIATRCGGPEMQIEDGVNGYLVPPNNVSALAEKMQHLADHPEEIVRLAGNIKQPVSIEQHVQELLDIYRSVTGRPE